MASQDHEMPDGAKGTSLRQVQEEISLSEDPRVKTTANYVPPSETAGLESNPTLRQRVPSKVMDSEEVRIERAIDLKAKRAGHLGYVRRRLKFVQGLLSEHASEHEVMKGVEDYEPAFHKFPQVDSHETYLSFEDNERMRTMANESYENEKECKFRLEVELSAWKYTAKNDTKGRSKSDHKSHRSSKTGKSSRTSSSSVRVKRRLLEKARLKVEALEQRQSLERRLEEEEAEFQKRELEIAKERERNKAEMARKIERMQVEMELKKATVDLEIEKEELQTERSDDETVSEIIPPLNPELIPHTPLRPFSLPQDTHLIPQPPSDIQATFSQSDMDPPHVPLPTPASQPKETRQKSSVRVDVDEFKLFVTKDEKSSPTDKFKSELQTPQPSHTQLEQVLLQTLQHLTQQPASPMP